MSQPTIRKKFISELNTELGMRRKVWEKTTDHQTKKITFVDMEHQRRYDILALLGEVLELMTDAEVNKFYERVERARAQTPPEPLFSP